MKKSLITIFLIAGLLAIPPLYAQTMKWKVVAPNALQVGKQVTTGKPIWGAIKTYNSVVLAGWKNMTLSTDFGTTWTALPAPTNKSSVVDIDIFDEQTFAFVTEDAAYYSSNQGATWILLKRVNDGRFILFDGSPKKIIVGEELTGRVDLLTIGGTTRIFSFPNYPTIISMKRVADGTLRGNGYNPPSDGVFISSVDDGFNWTLQQPTSGGDNNSFISDPLDPNRYVVVNEDFIFRTDNNADLFLTTDNGQSWQHPYSNPLGLVGDLNGNSTSGCHDYFVGTQSNGILRSLDKGLTWNSIGGPITGMDSRSISAVDDSLIFVIDQTGSIWSTDPKSHGVNSPSISGNQFFNQLNIGPCDTSVIGKIYFSNQGCVKLNISSLQLIGSDSLEYQTIGSLAFPTQYPDSISIRFTPAKSGKTNAKLKVNYFDGSSAIVDLSTNVLSGQVKVSPNALFVKDSISFCSSDSGAITFSSSCTLIITSLIIKGIDSTSFTLKGKNSAVLPKDSNIKIYCYLQHTGNLIASIHIVASDGRTWDVPIKLFVKSSPLRINPPSLFSTDTIASCAFDSSVLSVTSPCAFDISSLSITGADAASFIIEGKTSASLPADSLIKIICIPKHSGTLSANLHILGSDGRIWDVVLNPFIGATPLQFLPRLPFANDTIIWCLSDSTVVNLSASCPLDLSSITISGADAASFLISGKNSAALPNDSVIKILCNPQHTGNLNALLHIISPDGRTWDIPLSLFASEPSLKFQPASLFARDSLEFCSAIIDSVLLNALCNLDLASISITGVDASSFVLSGNQTASIPTDSIITVRCIPQHTGPLSASLHLITAGGVTRDILLSPFVKATPTISLDQKSIQNIYTDIIGDDVVIPITILHTGSSVNAEFTIHYDTISLIYHGTFDLSNGDHTTGRPDNHSARITFNSEIDTVLFAKFSFYPVDSSCTHIIIDSLRGAKNTIQCFSILTNSTVAEICSPI